MNAPLPQSDRSPQDRLQADHAQADHSRSDHARTDHGGALDVSRREFLRYGSAGSLGVWGLTRADAASNSPRTTRRQCLFVVLTGGPSHLETFDPKPDAPAWIRGPFHPVQTTVPGLSISETLPLLAQQASRFSLVRSLSHDAAPLHETGLQLIQTGRIAAPRTSPPAIGSVVASRADYHGTLAPYVVVPELLHTTGVQARCGQSAGLLGEGWAPATCRPMQQGKAESGVVRSADWTQIATLNSESAATRLKYGSSDFGQNCLLGRRLIEVGVPCVTINMYDSLAQRVTWDCHAGGPEAPTRFQDYRDLVCPQFDQGLSALLEDLDQRGLLETTLVVAVGEFGRTPRINRQGGRDHWTRCWSALVAGAGLAGGQVWGASDAHGAEPVDQPLHPSEFVASLYETLGVSPDLEISQADGSVWKLLDRPTVAIEAAS